MFGALTQKLQSLFSNLTAAKKLTEENISDAVRQVRLALLDADVNYSVTGEFVKRVKEKALGDAVVKSVKPSDQFIKIVHDELVALMGDGEAELDLNGKISTIMLCGLQGSGKTTTCAKLALYLTKMHKHKRVLMAACDLQRPAAVLQLKKLGADHNIAVFADEAEKNPVKAAVRALDMAKKEGFDVLLLDTAGRLHLDEALMAELSEIKQKIEPREILFVANASTGQDAVKTAAEFDKRVQITGTILTMLDSNARAGAAISIREVTKRPLKFEGVGEKVGDFQLFNPRSMADRILGMGDVINLVKKAEEAFDDEESAALEKKLRKAAFTYEDYLKQMKMVKRMGSFKGLLKMIPGFGMMNDLDFSENEFGKMEAMILSMTPAERQEKVELEHSRRRRVAKGAGVPLDDVNRMVKGFKKIKMVFKNMPNLDSKGKGSGLPDLESMKEMMKNKGKLWH